MRQQTSDFRPQTKDKGFLRVLSFLFLVCGLWSAVCGLAFAATSTTILEEIPVQNKGRIKPFQSFARESVLRITGSDSYQGKSASDLVWLWMARPEDWSKEPMIPVTRMLRADFPVMIVKNRLSAEIILQHGPFVDKVKEAWEKQKAKERLTTLEKERLDFYDRANLFHEIATGAVPGFIAHPDNPVAAWMPFQALSSPEAQQNLIQLYPSEKLAAVANALRELIETLRASGSVDQLTVKAKSFRSSLNSLFESQDVFIDPKAFRAELLYNRMHPFSWAWKLYLIAVLFFVAAMNFPKLALSSARTAMTLWACGFLIHLTGFVLRCIVAGRPPVTNMYESIIWVSFAAVFFSIILFAVYRNYLIPITSSCVAAFALILAESFPALLDPSIAPLVPVLRSNMWLTVHVLTITMSYGAFALAWGLGHAVVIGYARKPFDMESRKRLSSYLYRALQIGVILLASGTVLGGVWANYSWGRFWGWDPKETWALIALLGYLVVLHGRFTGWLDSFGAAAASVIAFTGVVMAWYGVNFVLAAGLHSYGFGGGGAPYVITAAFADLLLILGLTTVYRKKISQNSGAGARS
jgi:cytochrome c-type biogenesis protein CcsB